MKKIAGSTLFLGLALCSTWAGVQLARETLITNGRFTDGITEIKILGVCDFSNDTFSCWDLDGKQDKKLTDEVDREARNFSLPIRYKRENRFIVRSSITPRLRSVSWSDNWSSKGPGWSSPTALQNDSSFGDDGNLSKTLELVPYSPGVGENSLELTATIRSRSPVGATLIPKVGQYFKIGKAKFTLVKIEKSVITFLHNWTLTFEFDLGGESFMTLHITGLDQNGVPYNGSDLKGNPIRQPKEGMPTRYGGFGYPGMINIAQYGSPSGTGSLGSGRTQIMIMGDPAKVHQFMATAESTQRVKFTSIPLNPILQ